LGFINRLKDSLSKTRQDLAEKIDSLVTGKTSIDEGLFEELEDVLIQSDVGAETAFNLVDKLRLIIRENKISEPDQVKPVLIKIIQDILEQEEPVAELLQKPAVILVVGVNGVGKTTTIGKLAHYFKNNGKKVVLAAADTFRAAAIDQLEIWGKKTGVEVIKHQEGADPAAVAFDALQASLARDADILIVDTAGRLHTKNNLMEELKKIGRVLAKESPGAPHEILLVLDATTGQNAINQAKIFGAASGVTGIVLTKLDGTAKGGVVIGIKESLDIPVRYIGIGEGIDDLRPFKAAEFAQALFYSDNSSDDGQSS
jgi:fused signal recognition particle receptor